MKSRAISIMVLAVFAFGSTLVQAASDLPPILLSPEGGHSTDPALTGSHSLHAQLVTTYPPASPSDEDKLEIVKQKRERDIESSQDEHLRATTDFSRLPAATSGGCTIVTTIKAPGDDNCGLAWDEGYLWVSEGYQSKSNKRKILKIDLNGKVLSKLKAPGRGSSIGPKGLAHDGTYLWNVDFLQQKISKLTESGQVVGSVPTPAPASVNIPSGLAWDGNSLWVSEWLSYKIFKIDPASGEILKSFDAPDYGSEFPDGVPDGLAWDGTYLWASNGNGIYKLDPDTGSILEACNGSEFKYGRACGLTWDGQYLWAGSSADRTIIKISVSGNGTCTYSINPTNQSFGSTGGTGSVSVTAPSGCDWTATSNANWVTITSNSSWSGNGTVNYTVAVNTGAQRTGTMTIAGQTFTVTQSGVGPCPTPGTPSTPSPSNGATGVSTSPTLTWTATSNTDSYDVYFGTSSNPPYVGNTTSTSYSRSGLSNSTTYYWKVVAKKDCNNSTPGAVWSFTTGSAPCPTPGTPSTPSPSNGATGVSTSPTLTWTAISNTDSYDVYFGTSSNPPYVGNTTSPSYSRSGLSNNTTYYWKIVAKKNCGTSTSGAVWSFTTASAPCPTPGTPSTPSPSNGATGVSTSPTLTWAATSNTDSYDVYFGTSSSPPYLGNTTTTSYSRSGLSYSTTYHWKIVAKNNCGKSTPGSIWSFTTASAPCPTPGTPSTPSPSNGATGVSTSPTLTWTAISNTDSYDVYFGTSSNPPYVGNTTSTSYSRPGLSYSTTYYWKIVAKKNCGTSTPGPVWSFTTTSPVSSCRYPVHKLKVSISPTRCQQLSQDCTRLKVIATSPQIASLIASGKSPCSSGGGSSGCSVYEVYSWSQLFCLDVSECTQGLVTDISGTFGPAMDDTSIKITDAVSYCPVALDGTPMGACAASLADQCNPNATITLPIN